MNHWLDIKQTLPTNVQLVAVSKYHSAEQIAEVYASGCRDFCESRVQELQAKQAVLPKDIRWHFIGHLQTNKVRDLLRLRPFLIQSVDSEHLLRAINSEADKQGIIQDILLELHVAREETKSGLTPAEFNLLLPAISNRQYPNIRICGIMAMATNTDDNVEIRRCFSEAASLTRDLRLWIEEQTAVGQRHTAILSMGMSDDYQIAVSEGSNMVRIGSAIFD